MTYAEAVKLGKEAMLQARMDAIPQCDTLMKHGWKWEIPSPSGSEPWQWSWRRPPKRQGRKGRRYASTNQAFMALNRELTENKH